MRNGALTAIHWQAPEWSKTRSNNRRTPAGNSAHTKSQWHDYDKMNVVISARTLGWWRLSLPSGSRITWAGRPPCSPCWVALFGAVIYVCAVGYIPPVSTLSAAGAGPGAAFLTLWGWCAGSCAAYSQNPTGACVGAGTRQNAPPTGSAGTMQPVASINDPAGTAVTGFFQ